MNKSNTRETVFRQSYVVNSSGINSMNRSFISTAPVDDLPYGDDLRRSRIQNLPNYKKTNLGENVQFIVVFQTIEIERLSNEIEFLRVKVKEYERQLFNAQNYEVQIRQLTQKCFSLDREREEYRQELDKLNKICQTLYHENQMLKERLSEMDFSLKQKFESEKAKNVELMGQIQKWKARYQAAERSKAKEIEDLRNLMECQRKSMVDREIREITIRFQNERSNLENQIRKGREALENKNREIEELRQKCQKYQIQIMQMRNYEDAIADRDKKLAMLSSELMRLNQTLKSKVNELESLRNNQQNLRQQLKEQQQWEFQNKQLRGALESRERDLQNWKVKASRYEEELTRSRQMQIYNEELNNKLGLAAKEKERLNNLLKGRLDQIEQWKKRYSDKEMEINRYKNMENDIASYENKLNSMGIQNERINGILKSRLGEIENWKNKCNDMEGKANNLVIIEREKKTLENRFNDQIRQNEELQFTLDKLQKDLAANKRFQSQFQDAERQNNSLNKEIDRLNNLLKNGNRELDDFRTKYQKIEESLRQYRNIEGKVRDYENKIGLLTKELERLNGLISHKNAEIAELEKDKVDIHTKLAHYKNYEPRMAEIQQTANRYREQLGDAKREGQNWQKKVRQADGRANDLENQLFRATQEKERLNGALKTKQNDLDDLRNKYTRIEGDSRKVQELERLFQEQKMRNLQVVSDNQSYARKVQTMNEAIQRQKQYANEFASKVIVLSAQIERLSKDGAKSIKSKEFQQMREEISSLQRKVQSSSSEIEMLLNKVTSLQSNVSKLKGEFQRLLAEAERSEQETRQLVKQVEDYQDYAKRIHILGAQIDRLKAENKALDQDAKKIRLKYADGIKMEKKEEFYLMQSILMAVEIEQLRKRIEERDITHQQMRRSILEPVRRI